MKIDFWHVDTLLFVWERKSLVVMSKEYIVLVSLLYQCNIWKGIYLPWNQYVIMLRI